LLLTLWEKKFFGKMQEDLNTENSNLEDNLDMVNYILLHRIYDLLTVIANKIADEGDVAKLIAYHEQGFLLGPTPSYRNTGEENE
jgi:hypothetical protein